MGKCSPHLYSVYALHRWSTCRGAGAYLVLHGRRFLSVCGYPTSSRCCWCDQALSIAVFQQNSLLGHAIPVPFPSLVCLGFLLDGGDWLQWECWIGLRSADDDTADFPSAPAFSFAVVAVRGLVFGGMGIWKELGRGSRDVSQDKLDRACGIAMGRYRVRVGRRGPAFAVSALVHDAWIEA